MAYVDYAVVSLVCVLCVTSLAGLVTNSAPAALMSGAVVLSGSVVLIARMGLVRDGDDVVVLNMLSRHRIRVSDIAGWRFAALSLSATKGGCLELVGDDGRRIKARPMREESISWLESQGIRR